ncbi:hypothetical protein [Burkholderia sp. FERM BP-3421]|uniref:hypothetical protein n=1 Tax=Burkholderia sp. FERM BP-3421 TaxID=1494466 RepID=UPI002362548F|nr:hypothetical protein [Burkholderia sp. FERM BP-3421]
MGRKGSGIEIRAKSIRMTFVIDGVEVRRTLKVAGKAMLPTRRPTSNMHIDSPLKFEIEFVMEHLALQSTFQTKEGPPQV